MTRRQTFVSVTTGLILVATTLFLANWKRMQRLGEPGLQVVPESILGIEPVVDGTNATFIAGTNSVYLPEDVLDYTSEIMPVQRIVYDWLPADTTYGQRVYTAPDGLQIQNMVVLMGTDRTSIHQPQYCLTGGGWAIRKAEPATIRIPFPRPYDLPVMRLTTAGRFKGKDGEMRELSGVFVYWFVADGLVTNDHRERMWWMARDLLVKRTLQRWAYVICFAPCPPGTEDLVFERIKQFMAASVPEYHLLGREPGTMPVLGSNRSP